MKLSEALALERIKFNLEGDDKGSVIRELVDVAEQSGLLSEREQYLDRVLDREFLLSTGLGHGVAVPHAQAEGIRGLFCCLGISREGVTYESVDNEPARILCLICAEEGSDGPYLLLLSNITRLFGQREIREGVLAAASADEILAIIHGAEEAAASRV
jgi:mannitol/fructose-specific phosphotransferase system IIA component (Ntr-type)